MQGIIDATCRDCYKIIRWDTALPRLCADCWDALRQPGKPDPQSEPAEDETTEESHEDIEDIEEVSA